jgi:hypothetical protein
MNQDILGKKSGLCTVQVDAQNIYVRGGKTAWIKQILQK